METFLIRALQLILSLAILVLLHEFGHFLFARLFKVRVDKFYMFFNPNFSLIRAKKIEGKWQVKFFASNVQPNERIKLDENGNPIMSGKNHIMEQVPLDTLPMDDWRRCPESTEWGIGWLPLGGYCKISGMIDESMDKTQMAMPAQPWEFRSRSTWQRLPIITGGVLVNFILAMIIYSAVLFTWGEEYIPLQNAKNGLYFSKSMQEIGFRNGDNIKFIDGESVERTGDAIEKILIDNANTVTITRKGVDMNITIPKDVSQKALASKDKNILDIGYPFVLDEVTKGSPADVAKLQNGDSVVSINGKEASLYQEISQILDEFQNKVIKVGFMRNGALLTADVKLDDKGKLGISLKSPDNFFETKKIEYNFLQSIPAGIRKGWDTLTGYVKQLKLVFTKEGSKSLGGFGTIGKLFPPVWDWQTFWMMTAFLSVILAFMNLLPIPGLDGGYVLFIIYEMITGKKPSEKFMEIAVTTGMILLLALMVYANGNDIFKSIFGK